MKRFSIFLSLGVSLCWPTLGLAQSGITLYDQAQRARELESSGQITPALQLWSKIKAQGGAKRVEDLMGPRNLSWQSAADFWIQRLHRKQNLAARPVQISHAERRKIARGQGYFRGTLPVEQLDLLIAADLDGDGRDELVFLGSNGPLGQRQRAAFGIAKWNGTRFQTVWRGSRIPFMVHVTDTDGDGWKEIFCGYTPDSDDAGTLYFNGQNPMFW